MARGYIVTGLDIGTNTIKVLVAQKKGSEWEVLASSQISSFGLRRGAVVDADQTAKNVQLLISGIERDHNIKISSVFVNIGGSHLYVTPSDGIISVSRADQRISEEDVERVLQATKSINIPSNEEILDVFPKEFIIDNQRGIKQPLGLTGIRLEAKVILLCYFQSYFINLTTAVLNAKLQINDIIPSPLASAEAVLTPQQKELGVALIDMGSDTTSLAVYEEGDLIHLAVFPLGGANITKDIAIGLKTEFNIAEDIKKQYGSCILAKNGKTSTSVPLAHKALVNQSMTKVLSKQTKEGPIDSSSSLSFTDKNLVDIIEPRVSEILDLIQKELKKIGRQELLPGGVVLTGGGAKLSKIKELVKQKLKLTCEVGLIKGIVGVDQDSSLATVAGLVLSGTDSGGSVSEGILGFMGWFKKIFSHTTKMFKVFIP